MPRNHKNILNNLVINLPQYIYSQQSFHLLQFDKQKMKRPVSKSPLGVANRTLAKENEIQGLKQQIYQLKDLEYDLFKLNDEIASIQAKYSMVMDEKDRNEVLLRNKMTINRKNLQDIQSDVDGIRSQIDETTVIVANLTRDNVTLQRACENKENEIMNLNVTVKELEKTNQMKVLELQELEEMLKKFKENKVKMEEECEKLSKKLGENKENLIELDKETKNQLALERSLGSALQKLRQEGDELLVEMKARQNLLKQTSQQYQGLTEQTAQARQLNQKLDKQCKLVEENYVQVAKVLEQTQKVNEDKVKKLKDIEQNILKSEEDLDKSIIKKDDLMKVHTDLATQNKDLNLQIDDCLMKIIQLENVNKILQRHIENYIACDEEARIMLDRKKRMTELLETVTSKISKTESAIAHLF